MWELERGTSRPYGPRARVGQSMSRTSPALRFAGRFAGENAKPFGLGSRGRANGYGWWTWPRQRFGGGTPREGQARESTAPPKEVAGGSLGFFWGTGGGYFMGGAARTRTLALLHGDTFVLACRGVGLPHLQARGEMHRKLGRISTSGFGRVRIFLL